MAVVKAAIKSELEALYAAAKSGAMSEADFADGMADIIKNAILSADVVAGIVLTTPDTINGATTGLGTLL
jgi:hypothetical protein